MPSLRFNVLVTVLLLAAATGVDLCAPNGFIIPAADVCVLATFTNPTALPDKTIPEGTCPTGAGGG